MLSMSKFNIIKIINEEISDFDFLSNDEYQKEKEIIDLLKNEEFQKTFICDALLNKKNIKIEVYDSRIGGDWEDDAEDASRLTLEYMLKVTYTYDQNKEPVNFNLDFRSDGIQISKGKREDFATYDTPAYGEAWFNYFNWSDVEVNLTTNDGDDINFVAIKRAPIKIQILFIRHFIQDYIGNYTGLEIRTPEMKDNIQNTPYC
jgi:hypothetical protein